MSRSLRALVDGMPLPVAEARLLWERFSAWMETRAGDLAGFARAEGFASVHPELDGGCAVLVASRSEAQGPYAPARRTAAAAPNVAPKAIGKGSVAQAQPRRRTARTSAQKNRRRNNRV
jgi:hypothetical protein